MAVGLCWGLPAVPLCGGKPPLADKGPQFIQIAVLLGQIAPEQIRFHEDRSRIYRALGQDEATQVDAGEEALSPGKHQFLLCSDGFWEYILEGEMEGQLKASATPQEWLDRMCSLLRERVPDNNDNNSAAAVWVEC